MGCDMRLRNVQHFNFIAIYKVGNWEVGERGDAFLNWDVFKDPQFSSFDAQVVSVISAPVLQIRPQAVLIMWRQLGMLSVRRSVVHINSERESSPAARSSQPETTVWCLCPCMYLRGAAKVWMYNLLKICSETWRLRLTDAFPSNLPEIERICKEGVEEPKSRQHKPVKPNCAEMTLDGCSHLSQIFHNIKETFLFIF